MGSNSLGTVDHASFFRIGTMNPTSFTTTPTEYITVGPGTTLNAISYGHQPTAGVATAPSPGVAAHLTHAQQHHHYQPQQQHPPPTQAIPATIDATGTTSPVDHASAHHTTAGSSSNGAIVTQQQHLQQQQQPQQHLPTTQMPT
eukprot:10904448-Ditylum_brightwellii.AAC.1